MKNNTALTLVEILLVTAVIGIISIPLYISYTRTQANQSLKANASQVSDAIRSAHVFGREAKDQKAWGVRRKNEKTYELIAGSRDTFTVQKTFALETFVSIPNNFIIWFDIGTGTTVDAGSIIIKNNYGRQIKINVSKTGVVDLQDAL